MSADRQFGVMRLIDKRCLCATGLGGIGFFSERRKDAWRGSLREAQELKDDLLIRSPDTLVVIAFEDISAQLDIAAGYIEAAQILRGRIDMVDLVLSLALVDLSAGAVNGPNCAVDLLRAARDLFAGTPLPEGVRARIDRRPVLPRRLGVMGQLLKMALEGGGNGFSQRDVLEAAFNLSAYGKHPSRALAQAARRFAAPIAPLPPAEGQG
jgi:hypothetical protein